MKSSNVAYAFILFLIFLLDDVSSVPGSAGTQFTFTFVKNVKTITQILSVRVINDNNITATFTIGTRSDYSFSTPLIFTNYSVQPGSFADVPIPSWYGFGYSTVGGVQMDKAPFQTITASSDQAVTVIASNFDNTTNTGDTYLILPNTLVGTDYAFSLPGAYDQHGYNVVVFLPSPTALTMNNTVSVSISGSSPYTFTMLPGDQHTVYWANRPPAGKATTYRISATYPLGLVAGVTCAGLSSTQCDHSAFMPQPLASSMCMSYDYIDDDHSADLRVVNSFYVDVPLGCYYGSPVSAVGSKATGPLNIDPTHASPLMIFDANNYGSSINFHSAQEPTHITRAYNGFSVPGKRGFALSSVPSLTQFLDIANTRAVSFFTWNNNDQIDVFCKSVVCVFIQIDGVALSSLNATRDTHMIDGDTYFIFTINVATSGMHKLTVGGTSTSGKYLFHVYALNGTRVYAYYPALNMNTAALLPTTTAGPTTSPPSIPTNPTTATPATMPPTSPTVAPTSPTSAPTSPTTAPMSNVTSPTSPTIAPTSPTVAPTSPTVAPTSPTVAPTSPTVAPTSPTLPPSSPTVPVVTPSTSPSPTSTSPGATSPTTATPAATSPSSSPTPSPSTQSSSASPTATPSTSPSSSPNTPSTTPPTPTPTTTTTVTPSTKPASTVQTVQATTQVITRRTVKPPPSTVATTVTTTTKAVPTTRTVLPTTPTTAPKTNPPPVTTQSTAPTVPITQPTVPVTTSEGSWISYHVSLLSAVFIFFVL